jgi:hypothetical protein
MSIVKNRVMPLGFEGAVHRNPEGGV